MTAKQIILIALDMSPSFYTEDAKLKAAARKLRDSGTVKIEVRPIDPTASQRAEGYTITKAAE